jgi:hypothetical protein
MNQNKKITIQKIKKIKRGEIEKTYLIDYSK